MIGEHTDGWKWAQASGLSVTLHVAILGYLVWQPSFDFLMAAPPAPLTQIEITTLPPPQTTPEVPQVSTETLSSETGTGETETGPDPTPPGPKVITSSALPELVPPGPEDTLPVPTPADYETAVLSQPSGQAGNDPSALPIQASTAEAEPLDPRLLELIGRIRDRLTEPCLLALPMRRGEGNLHLSVLSDNDHNITALTDSLTAGIEGDITREAVLLDPRQCPAAAFARRDQHYPVFGLGLQIDTQTIIRGGTLHGQISNGAGYYQTLLLVDENGVVHDLRRFLVSSSRMTRFDFPVARWRAPRDTHQLLIAIATPARPDTITAHAGKTADKFFDALFSEIGQNALIGITSFYTQ
ncbi:MAG: hypothetical protein ACK5II_14560 [Paracoccus sp. (in: a-proteobacteria)]